MLVSHCGTGGSYALTPRLPGQTKPTHKLLNRKYLIPLPLDCLFCNAKFCFSGANILAAEDLRPYHHTE
jgi:hypothetical protein